MNISTAQIFENRKRWAEALRSGRFAQTTGCLRNERGYCCLGVGYFELLGREPGQGWNPVQREPFLRAVSITLDDVSRFATANDNEGKTFAEIADMVDALPAPEVPQ